MIVTVHAQSNYSNARAPRNAYGSLCKVVTKIIQEQRRFKRLDNFFLRFSGTTFHEKPSIGSEVCIFVQLGERMDGSTEHRSSSMLQSDVKLAFRQRAHAPKNRSCMCA